MNRVNRRWIYSSPVVGALATSNFSGHDNPIPEIGQGQTLVRNRLISLDPANRVYLTMETYRPKVNIGDVMAGFGIGEVLESTDSRFQPGDLVHGDLGWQDYAVINSEERSAYVYRCTQGYSESDLLGVLGITGLTAYFGLQEYAKLSPGMTVVVGGATGACGVILGQLAKIAGCRVVGFAGGPEKCAWLVDEMGFDAAVDYTGDDAKDDLRGKCPDGIDFFSDAIGGAITEAAIPLMKPSAPWYHYGNLSAYDRLEPGAPNAGGLSSEVMRICAEKDLKPSFMLVFDYYSQRPRAEAEIAGLMQEGRLKAPTTTLEGFELLPEALVDGTFGGKKYGKLNVRLAS